MPDKVVFAYSGGLDTAGRKAIASAKEAD